MVVFMYGTAIEYNGVQLCFLMEYTQLVLLLCFQCHTGLPIRFFNYAGFHIRHGKQALFSPPYSCIACKIINLHAERLLILQPED